MDKAYCTTAAVGECYSNCNENETFLMASFSNFVALLLYEVAVTYDREVHHIWKRRTSIASWIFLFNRYTVLSLYLVNLSMYFSADTEVSRNEYAHWLCA